MILVDTSIWIDHLRSGRADLAAALNADQVLTHPFIIGEVACGNLRQRREVLRLLDDLPGVPVAAEHEARTFLEQRGLMGKGIGYVDVHLLASASLHGDARLWTADRPLARVAAELGLVYRR